jgi:hypothetical protein
LRWARLADLAFAWASIGVAKGKCEDVSECKDGHTGIAIQFVMERANAKHEQKIGKRLREGKRRCLGVLDGGKERNVDRDRELRERDR